MVILWLSYGFCYMRIIYPKHKLPTANAVGRMVIIRGYELVPCVPIVQTTLAGGQGDSVILSIVAQRCKSTCSNDIIAFYIYNHHFRLCKYLLHNCNLFDKSNMSNKTDGSYELFYNAAESIVNNAILLDENATILDELNGFV